MWTCCTMEEVTVAAHLWNCVRHAPDLHLGLIVGYSDTQFKWILDKILCFVNLNPSKIFVNKPTWRTNFSFMFISILYMFRATMCPSSGELLYQCDTWFMSLCVDDSLVCRLTCIPDGYLHRETYTKYRIDTVNISWWWAHGCPKHVENRNKHTWKICASSWFIYKDGY